MNASPRKPIVALFEHFVLDVIGALDTAGSEPTARLVTQVFGASADWRTRFKEELGLADGLEAQLRDLWGQARAMARERNVEVSARDFAETVVEENFLEVLELLETALSAERVASYEDG